MTTTYPNLRSHLGTISNSLLSSFGDGISFYLDSVLGVYCTSLRHIRSILPTYHNINHVLLTQSDKLCPEFDQLNQPSANNVDISYIQDFVFYADYNIIRLNKLGSRFTPVLPVSCGLDPSEYIQISAYYMNVSCLTTTEYQTQLFRYILVISINFLHSIFIILFIKNHNSVCQKIHTIMSPEHPIYGGQPGIERSQTDIKYISNDYNIISMSWTALYAIGSPLFITIIDYVLRIMIHTIAATININIQIVYKAHANALPSPYAMTIQLLQAAIRYIIIITILLRVDGVIFKWNESINVSILTSHNDIHIFILFVSMQMRVAIYLYINTWISTHFSSPLSSLQHVILGDVLAYDAYMQSNALRYLNCLDIDIETHTK
eukprot:690158_1